MMMDMMTMYFHQRIREFILFREWHTTTNAQFVLSCFGVAALGLLLELFKTFRLYLYRRSDQNEIANGCCDANILSNATSYGATAVPSTETTCECPPGQSNSNSGSKFRPYATKNLLNRTHQVQSILFFIQAFFSFALMLIAMTYNTALFLSLVFGHTLGFFFTQPLFTPVEKIRIGACCCD